MDIVTYITPSAEKNAKKHSRLDRLQRLLHKIAEDQTLTLLIPFSDKRFFKKRMSGSNFRILLSRHIYQGHIVLCAFEFISRGNYAYDNIWKKIGGLKDIRGANELYQKITKENSSQFAISIKNYRYNPTPPLPPEPNEQENLWLDYGGKAVRQIKVLETKDWMDAQATERFTRSANAIHAQLIRLYEIIDDSLQHINIIIEPPFIEADVLDGEDFRIHLQYFPSHQLLFLLDLTEKNIAKPSQFFTPDAKMEELIKHARRAYPLDVFLLNPDDFAKIQKEDEGNLALSPEEIRILNHVHSTAGERFPLFINGRAGSGKSTILQYLLKDYLYLAIEHWDEKNRYTPLYLTYSKKLLDSATLHLNSLLESNSKVLLSQSEQWKKKYHANKDKVFSSTFKLFQSFMIELLPEKSRIRFESSQYIGYAQFKQLWGTTIARQGSLKRRYSVDLVWHVIRTYIKGMSGGLNSFLTPEKYADLPDKYKSVNNETFTDIYSSLWENWYQKYCEQHHLWDEQDLALSVIAEAEFPQTYPAIFCDEAQDFTVIELKILYYLSLFSDRTVSSYKIGNVPFVFAGDPLQTLNPTGFRWEAVKSSFYNYLLKPIEKRTGTRSKTDINYEELLSNYRSSKNIVDFCNAIQLLRLGLFNNTYRIQAQQTWFPIQGMAPFIYSTKGPKAYELLQHEALVIIPNCHENEETDYVKKDRLLKESVECDEEGIPITVLSPSAAKGLEYNEIVVLYRFGASCPQSLLDRLQGRITEDPGPAVTIEWEYFLNRLYVAASRAKKRLVILDDSKTFKEFWGFMQNMDVELLNSRLGSSITVQDWGGDKLLAPKEGSSKDMEDLLLGRRSDDSKELAEKYYREGTDAENPRLLRRARMLYERLGRKTKAQECYAHALVMENKYELAASTYLQMDEHLLALDCFWQAASFTDINNTHWFDEAINDLRIVLARHVESRKPSLKWSGNLPTTQSILKRLQNTHHSIHSGNKGWLQSLTLLLEWLEKDYDKGAHLKNYWKTIRDIANRLDYPQNKQAAIAYKLESYRAAQLLWKATGKTAHERYYHSLYKNSEWPETLYPLKQLHKFKKIIMQWQDRGKEFNELNETQIVIIVEAMIETGKLSKATHLLKKQHLIGNDQARLQLSKLLWQQIKPLIKQSKTDVVDAISLYATALINTHSWSLFFSLFDKVDDLKQTLTQTQYYKIDQEIIKQLVYNPNLVDAPEDVLEKLSILTKQRFYTTAQGWLPMLERKIGVALFGALLEYTKHYADAKAFYFWITKYARLTSTEHNFFDNRIAACLQKQADQRRLKGKPVDMEERKLDSLKKKLKVSFIRPEPDPAGYPISDILESRQINQIRESLRPVSTAENKAKQKIKTYSIKQDEKQWLQTIQNYTKILAEQEKWHKLAQNWCNKQVLKRRYSDSSRTQRKKVLESVLQIIIEPLALSRSIIESKREDKVQLSYLLTDSLKDVKDADENIWVGCDHLKIDYDLVGAYLERVARHVDIISFYEWALDEARTRRERSYMAERLIAAQENYADYLIKDNNYETPKKAKTLQQNANDLREKYRLIDKKIVRYVEV